MPIVRRAGENSASLCAGQTDTGASTNIIDTGTGATGPLTVQITSTVGSTPSATVATQASLDGVNWWSIPTGSSSASLVTIQSFTITTATTTAYFIPAGYVYRYFRLFFSANTNVTLTADVWFG